MSHCHQGVAVIPGDTLGLSLSVWMLKGSFLESKGIRKNSRSLGRMPERCPKQPLTSCPQPQALLPSHGCNPVGQGFKFPPGCENAK